MKTLKSFFSALIMTIALFAFSACSNTGKGMQEDFNENTEAVEDAAEEAGDEIEEETDDLDN